MIPSIVAGLARGNLFDYLRTTYALADAQLEEELFAFLDGPGGLFRGPYLDVRLPFRKAPKGTAVPLDVKPPFDAFAHQLRAFERLTTRRNHQPQNTLVTTGTGSGKTECFLYPILDHCLRHSDQAGIKAILLYPMNALATDQAGRIAKELWDDPRLKGVVTAHLYVGGKGRRGVADREHLVDAREAIRRSPPDILLTNYKMLDFLLMRPDDRELWRDNTPETLRFLVLDELHTYDGAQGSDVACLIRRLKQRLGIEPGTMACVGTSATIGEGDETSKQRLRDFAQQIFDEEFFSESVIVEDRKSADEALGSKRGVETHPEIHQLPTLDPESGVGSDEWLKAQVSLWLGPGAASWSPVEIGDGLRKHEFLRSLLHVGRHGPIRYEDLIEGLAARLDWFEELDAGARRAALDSFIAVVSHARSQDKGRVEPFLGVQVQLWMREVRGLLRAVDEEPRFTWRSELGGHRAGGGDSSRWLPLVRCRDCGSAGWAAVQKDGSGCLSDDGEESIGRAWMERKPTMRYVAFGHGTPRAGEQPKFKEYLCPRCLKVHHQEVCDCEGDSTPPGVPVRLCSDLTSDGVARFRPLCPDCEGEDSLIFLASRGASLLSVAISHLFQTEYNADPKLLAFTDSVQDASHRAGFFGARTYRFNLRTLIQAMIADAGGTVALRDVGETLLRYAIQNHGGAGSVVPTLTPHDLREHPQYVRFIERKGKQIEPEMRAWLADRLSLEVVFEYGLRVRQGRSLDKIGCSTVGVDPEPLDRAVAELELILSEEGFLESRSSDITHEELRIFVLGLLHRLRLRGGVHHAWLDPYVKASGSRFHLSKKKNPYLVPFAPDSVLPRFLRKERPSEQRSAFDAFGGAADAWTWYRDWAARSLQLDRKDSGIDTLYETALDRLVHQGVFASTVAERGKRPVWGVNPDHLTLVEAVRVMVCDACGDSLRFSVGEADRWEGKPCMRYRCAGKLGSPAVPEETFYTRIFRSGRVSRVYPAEHTGLLNRAEREDLEDRFKSNDPAAPNLLVCTPTLEMGIDIGDLSAVFLCSVPPTTAMYLQRIGRAGRSTGNALCMTMSVQRPHDLYFHAEPTEMMAGSVDPPGCFLDAPEMLKRQLVASAMDAWAREDHQVKNMPRKVAILFGKADGDPFPKRFVAFHASHKERLVGAFLARFDAGRLTQANRVELTRYGLSEEIPEAFQKAFDEVRLERLRLKRLRDTATRRIEDINANPGDYDDPVVEKEEAERTKGMLAKLWRDLGDKYPLNVLTDAGVLPNYAFPEPGVVLESVVGYEEAGKRRYESFEYLRPASVAIRELAPFNTFYAHGRRVQVDEIDLGTPAAPLTEDWRMCARCSHMERVVEGGRPPSACPSCGDRDWPDTGQVRTLVHFRRSCSLEKSLEVATADDGEDRRRVFYQTLDLIDVERGNRDGARWIECVPFGFEFLKQLKLREVNFGPDADGTLQIAGEAVSESGFLVCSDCGRVQPKDSKKELQHAVTCKDRRGQATQVESVYLYREISSEALRILMPFVQLDQDTGMASFKAALGYGLRQRYGGRADHLQIKSMREPLAGEGYRYFLVLFDTVPGGTGQLNDLRRSDALLDVLETALTGLSACECYPEKDGCYRCLFAFQGQRELELTSSKRAQEILTEILAHRAEIADIGTLSDVSLDSKEDSELEVYFRRALERRVSQKGEWHEVIRRGEKRWDLRIGQMHWEMQAQVDLGPHDGVRERCRPDYLLRPMSIGADSKPIAVFCDGFAYHVKPGEELSPLEADVRKRSSILESGRYRVWSLTWADVRDFEAGAATGGASLLIAPPSQAAGKLLTRWGCPARSELADVGSMELLLRWLAAPEAQRWETELVVVGANCAVRPRTLQPDEVGSFETCLRTSEPPCSPPPEVPTTPTANKLSGVLSLPHLQALGWLPFEELRSPTQVHARWTVRLEDDAVSRGASDYESSWRAFLQAWNLLQFVPESSFTTTSSTSHHEDQAGAAYASTQPGVVAQLVASEPGDYGKLPWDPDLLTSQELRVLETVHAACGVEGVAGYELVGAGNRVGAEAQLAWEQPRVAVVVGGTSEDVTAFEAQDWLVVDSLESPDEIASVVKGRMKTVK